jgi:protein-S-isoprenylcysteine O-methyltransferase Ste14
VGLKRRALSGLVKFQVVLALLILLPAWTVRFWQAWIYWGLFTGCALITTVYLLKHDPQLIERRLRAGPAAEPRSSQKKIQAVAFAAITVTYVVAGFDRHFRWSPAVPTALVLVANGAVVVGFLIMLLTLRANPHASAIVEVRESQAVVSTGLYAWVRHPMYVGGIVLFLATPIALGSIWALLPVFALIGAVIVRLLDEERFLTMRLAGYKDYKERVRSRLIPGVW